MSSTSKDGLLGLTGTFLGLSIISLGLRLYVRGKERMRPFVDDWFAVLGVVCFLGSCIVTFLFVHYKILGYASSDFTPAEVQAQNEPSGKLGYAFDFINTTTLAAIKLSALFLYQRLLVSGARKRDYFNGLLIAMAVIVVCWYITFMFLAAFQCRTHFQAVSHGEGDKYCDLNFPWALGLAVSDFLLDLIVLVLPMHRIWQLRISTAKKLSIMGIFALAFVGLGASIARLYFYVHDRGGVFWLHHDFERLYTQIIYIQMLESGISITAINIPCLWGLFQTKFSEKVLKGIRSIASSIKSDSSRSTSYAGQEEGETKPGFSTQHASFSEEGSVREEKKEAWEVDHSRHPAFDGELESQTFVAHEPVTELPRAVLPRGSGSIQVDKSFEVRHQ